ncbi:L-serine ammonia-lyase, iron-sulfur-dependent, subunit alpha [Anaerocolumna xylanovorans]|uniref:L-serine dehydratase n=1 Tax=Anaerocolumna xylanovorans DSM 12503 TaxID=1121345 RepID=A0A1M7Y0B8_9FIRM|nr:L-serine ammonia-lyase, iron-sulfur-dependent, subunit alpha [Anaerocolumna xylanovorans]SHO44961.1 L-serine dehydratase [Anaerocolumna xylanovorans DSM 12503]
MEFKTGKTLLQLCREKNLPISEIMLLRETEISQMGREEIYHRMSHSWDIMKDAAKGALKGDLKSMGGLIGGESLKLTSRRVSGEPTACGQLVSKAVSYAMGVLEVNSSMGLIVAAPTAGSSGVIPGTFLAIQEEYGFTDKQMVMALFTAGAIGYLITYNATIAGAEGGCQAEVGSASAMAAAAVTELLGGSAEACFHAATSAISNLLGLVCDPIGGLVEAPCQQRNAIGVSNAMICAEIALSGIRNLVPFDEAVDVMYRVGKGLPGELRETALGGMAAAPSACALCGLCN